MTDYVFTASNSLLAQTRQTIPLASQTFSKSYMQFPLNISPQFIARGLGSQVWDIDGNQYTDFINGLLSVTLGYADLDVNNAISKQLSSGITFSLPHPLEGIVAQKMIDIIPCAEMVRFGKNGSDATSGAIRLARAFTDRDHIAVCGYHGWQDWYIGSTSRDAGIPATTKALTHKFQYNDIESLKALFAQHPQQIAAVILEPMNFIYPENDFLVKVRDLAHQHGSLLIFDETITGFRFALGGAQELLGVTPDLATFGKGLANGMPLSAIVGRKDIMMLMEEVFFSFTFGGETLSLAAANAVLDKLQNEPVIEQLYATGERLLSGLSDLFAQHPSYTRFVSVIGTPPWSLLNFQDVNTHSQFELKTFWMQEILKRGILSFGSHNMSYAHTNADIDNLLTVYETVFGLMNRHLEKGDLRDHISSDVLKPIFKVRDT